MKIIAKLIASFGLSLILVTGAVAETISPPEAAQHVGSTATVEGVVSQVSISRKGTIFINFGGRYPNHVFYGVIFKGNAGRFPNAQTLEGHTVAISGTIKSYEGKPEIIISSPSQIEVR